MLKKIMVLLLIGIFFISMCTSGSSLVLSNENKSETTMNGQISSAYLYISRHEHILDDTVGNILAHGALNGNWDSFLSVDYKHVDNPFRIEGNWHISITANPYNFAGDSYTFFDEGEDFNYGFGESPPESIRKTKDRNLDSNIYQVEIYNYKCTNLFL